MPNLMKKIAEQDGADQPATAPEFKLEVKEKHKAESERRSPLRVAGLEHSVLNFQSPYKHYHKYRLSSDS